MILKHLFYSILGLLGVATIVGTGFCTWVFIPENGIPPVEAKVAIEVTEYAKTGTFSFGDDGNQKPNHMVLDEGSYGEMNLFDGLTFYRKTQISVNDGGEKTATVIENNDDLEVVYTMPTDFDPSANNLEPELGIHIELVDTPLDATDTDLTNRFAQYVSVVDTITENVVNVDGKDYFMYNQVDAKHLHTLNIINKTVDATKSIRYIFNLSYLFKYTDFEHKPTTAARYNKIRLDMYKRARKVKINLIGRYKEKSA